MSLLRRTWGWLGGRSAVRVVQVMVIAITATVVFLAREQSENVACNARFNAETAKYDQRRAEIAASERKVLDDLWRQVRDNPGDFRASIDHYLEARRVADVARAESPTVPPPADLCQ